LASRRADIKLLQIVDRCEVLTTWIELAESETAFDLENRGKDRGKGKADAARYGQKQGPE
jgi:hypothetical protein